MSQDEKKCQTNYSEHVWLKKHRNDIVTLSLHFQKSDVEHHLNIVLYVILSLV